MFKNYLKVIIRSMRSNRLYTITNILGLSVAMMGFVIVSLFVNYEMSYDKFHDQVEEVFMLRMKYPDELGGFYNQFLPPVLASSIKQEIPGVDEVTITGTGVGNVDVSKVGGELIAEKYYAFEPSFFNIFSFTAKYGDAKEALSDPNSIVISRSFALKYFNKENVIGELLNLTRFGEFKIGAVLDYFPENSQFQPNLVLPILATTSENRLTAWGSNSHFVYLKVPPSTDKKVLAAQITALYKKNMPDGVYSDTEFFPFKDSYWEWSGSGASLNNRSNGLGADKNVMIICSSLALILLVVALANYVNLASSRALQRSKEVGVRKVNGASPNQLIIQFLSESIIFSVISLIVALIGAELVLPTISKVMGITLELDLLSAKQVTMLLSYAVLCGLLAGFYPAIFMSRFNPIKVLKTSVSSGADKLSFFKILLGLQFTVSALMVTGILIFNKQLNHYINFDLGFNTERVVAIDLSNELRGNADALINDLRGLSEVKGVTLGPLPAAADGSSSVSFGEAKVENVTRIQTDENFLPVMGIKLVTGRNFDVNISTDFESGILINKKLAKALSLSDPFGAQVSLNGSNKEVLGVFDDIYADGAMSNARNLLLLPRLDQIYRVLVRVNNSPVALAKLEETYKIHDQAGLFKYTWLDEAYGEKYHRVSRVAKLINGATALIVFVSIFGLFAMLAFSINNRLKEIGVRKVLGGKLWQIQWTIARPYFIINLIAFMVATPLAYFLLELVMNNYPNRVEQGIGTGITSFLIIIAFNLMIVAIRGISLQRLKPTDILRGE